LHTLAGDDDRLFCARDQLGQLCQGGRIAPRRAVAQIALRRVQPDPRLFRHLTADDWRLQHQRRRSRARQLRMLEGQLQAVYRLVRFGGVGTVLRHRAQHGAHVGCTIVTGHRLVHAVHAEAVVARRIGEHDHRRARKLRLKNAERTGGAGERALAHEHTRPAGELAVDLRHHRSGLFTARQYHAELVSHLVELIEHPSDAQTRQREGVAGAALEQRLNKGILGGGQSRLSVDKVLSLLDKCKRLHED